MIYKKPLVMTMSDGHNSYSVEIDEIMRRIGEFPIIHGHIIEQCKTRRPIDSIKDVIFNDPATIVIWADGSKTVVKCQPGDIYSEELGLAMCIAKKYYGNTGAYNEVFKRFIAKESEDISVEDMRQKLDEFCKESDCFDCKLKYPACRCGFGVTFKSKRGKQYELTDDEIRDAYPLVFGDNRDSNYETVNRSPRVGDYIEIIDAGIGAYGADGARGYVTRKKHTDGLLKIAPGYNVKLNDGEVWRISADADVRILKPCDKKEV